MSLNMLSRDCKWLLFITFISYSCLTEERICGALHATIPEVFSLLSFKLEIGSRVLIRLWLISFGSSEMRLYTSFCIITSGGTLAQVVQLLVILKLLSWLSQRLTHPFILKVCLFLHCI